MRRVTALFGALLIISLGVVGLESTAAPAPAANAASGSDFTPGKIITDANMHDTTTMNSDQIQSFLQSKEGGCAAGASCLKNYVTDIGARSADSQCGASSAQSGVRASTVIWQVAVACSINPQVILVLLEKEQGLVTATNPSAARYNAATGYACPDSTGCSSDPKYGGLYNQVYWAAWQFQYYEKHTSSFNYYGPGKVRSIRYSPDASCGSASVYIENQATADLYYYTPYTPNAASLANLYGTGDSCSSYGNRNFWRIYSDWFGSPSGPRSTFGSFDGAYPVIGGIEVSGWSLDPYGNGSPSYVWVAVDGSGGPAFANLTNPDITASYPNAGTNHGYDTVVAASPGTHQVCVYNTVLLGCKTVTVTSSPNAGGAIEAASASIGSVTISGWSLDTRTSAPSYIWVTVDGNGATVIANGSDDASLTKYPGLGNHHGFTYTARAPTGAHLVCVYGTDSVSLGCKRLTVPTGARGGVDPITTAPRQIHLTGWSLDLANPSTSTYIWVTVDGNGGPQLANGWLNWIDAYFPGAGVGPYHGYDVTLGASPGTHQVCVYGTDSVSFGCQQVTVTTGARGGVGAVTAVAGGVKVSGWSLDLTTPSTSTYIWVNIDNSGDPQIANLPLNWIDGYFPGQGVGPNHGFDVTIPTSAGTHQVCVYGSDSISYGCTTVHVTAAAQGAVGNVTGIGGGVRLQGWSLDLSTPSTPTYIWVNVDGVGGPAIANLPLNWIDGYFSGWGVGPNHGFDVTIPTSPGTHSVCAYGSRSIPLGCSTVTTTSSAQGGFGAATAVSRGIEVTGWWLDLATPSTSTYVWVNVDGTGGPAIANVPLNWIDGYFAGAGVGPNHGFDVTLPAARGTHQVCVYGSQSIPLGCKNVTVN